MHWKCHHEPLETAGEAQPLHPHHSGCGCRHGHRFMRMLFGLSFMACPGNAIWYTMRMTMALETLAMVKALDKPGDRMGEPEKAHLEGHIRARILPSRRVCRPRQAGANFFCAFWSQAG